MRNFDMKKAVAELKTRLEEIERLVNSDNSHEALRKEALSKCTCLRKMNPVADLHYLLYRALSDAIPNRAWAYEEK